MKKVTYQLCWYEKRGDDFVGSLQLVSMSDSIMRSLFDLSPDEPIIYVYPIFEKHIDYLRSITGNEINIDEFDYFIESVSDEEIS
jgi:hypothetical protein